MENVVVSLGGSVLITDDDDTVYLKEVAEVFRSLDGDVRLQVVVGGGALARRYIAIARQLGSDEATLDEIGIAATRLNARILITALGGVSNPVPPTSYDEALTLSASFPIVVMGGVSPGYTTDTVAALLAERSRSHRLVNATNVDHVYSADPRKDPGAKALERLSHAELLDITSRGRSQAGSHEVVDPLACKIAARSGITLCVVNGRDLKELGRAVAGGDFRGTVIRD